MPNETLFHVAVVFRVLVCFFLCPGRRCLFTRKSAASCQSLHRSVPVSRRIMANCLEDTVAKFVLFWEEFG